LTEDVLSEIKTSVNSLRLAVNSTFTLQLSM